MCPKGIKQGDEQGTFQHLWVHSLKKQRLLPILKLQVADKPESKNFSTRQSLAALLNSSYHTKPPVPGQNLASQSEIIGNPE
jgi:hypothetical protein